MARPQDTVQIMPAELPEALRYQRSEARMPVTLPARMTTVDGDILPVLLADLSPTGVLLVTDPEGKSHAYQIESNILRTTNGGT